MKEKLLDVFHELFHNLIQKEKVGICLGRKLFFINQEKTDDDKS